MKILNKFAIGILFFAIIISFIPKKNLYFLAEQYLKEQKVIFTKEMLSDNWLAFNINSPEIYYEDILVGSVSNIKVLPLIVYNKIELQNGAFSKEIKNFLPQKIEQFKVTYTPFYPIVAFIDSKGDYGELTGKVYLKERKISLVLKPASDVASKYPMILSKFKKEKDEYIYESNF
ncbi:MAG: hypothetical protein HXX81_01385 [Campylobacterales bacterium]|nr:hypothetical protein [Campylobacterales bacterium]